jgi:hypothetical protein
LSRSKDLRIAKAQSQVREHCLYTFVNLLFDSDRGRDTGEYLWSDHSSCSVRCIPTQTEYDHIFAGAVR